MMREGREPEREMYVTIIVFFAILLEFYIFTPVIMSLLQNVRDVMNAQGGTNLLSFTTMFYNFFYFGWFSIHILGLVVLILRLWNYLGRKYYASEGVVYVR